MVEQQVEQAKVTVGQVVELAREGRKEVLPALRKMLDNRPELWRHLGNIAYQAQSHWLELIGGHDLYFREAMARHAAALRAELAGPDATPLEQLQVARIVALNLQVGYYETLLAKHEGSGSGRVLDYLHERCGVADRRLQQAILNLARVRKLLPGVLKVDVVISGEVQATVNGSDSQACGTAATGQIKRVRVPKNRIDDLLAAAKN